MNVWAPADGYAVGDAEQYRKHEDDPVKRPGNLPVFVWFFGGGLQVGNTAEMEFDGERIARRGVVVVTVNYRLNAFGFLSHPDLTREDPSAPANFGFLDQQFAMKWVKRNIAAFGGDPGNITIGGQSAGGMSVCAQLTSPQNEGLFQKAIIMSGMFSTVYGSAFPRRSYAENEQEGVKFRFNEELIMKNEESPADGTSVANSSLLTLNSSLRDYDAVVIATGTPTARDLKAPGRELKGIHLALELLSQQNRVLAGKEFPKEERVTAKGKKVLVIGGGDTGSDCIGTAHRQGCKSVTQIEIMPKPPVGHNPNTPWPNWPVILKTTSSHEEGCDRRWLLNTNKFIGDENGNVKGVEVEGVIWEPNPDGGRPIMKLDGKKEVIEADIVFLAMGFLKPEHPDYPDNVFVCGDAANGASLVVRAIASGLDVARKVNTFLSK